MCLCVCVCVCVCEPKIWVFIKIDDLTLTSEVNRQSQVTTFVFFEITDLDLVRIDTKIKSVSCMQPKITKVI